MWRYHPRREVGENDGCETQQRADSDDRGDPTDPAHYASADGPAWERLIVLNHVSHPFRVLFSVGARNLTRAGTTTCG